MNLVACIDLYDIIILISDKSATSSIVSARALRMDWTPLSLCFAVTIFAAGSPNTWAIAINRNLLEAIRYTESGGDVCAIKDSGRYLGPYLIEQNHYSDAISANATLTANSDGIIILIS